MVVRIGTTDVSVLQQVFGERQYDTALPSAPKRIIDAGANIGLAAVFFANKYPEAEIVAIEPEESNFKMLTLNAGPYPNIRAVRGGLWSHAGKLVLVDPDLGNHGFQTVGSDAGESAEAGVAAFTVESLMTLMKWDGVDLLKVDIEGAEKEVFESSESWIGRVGTVMIELHDGIKPGCSQAFSAATASFGHRAERGEVLVVSSAD